MCGWEPATTYVYDDAGRIAETHLEPEWDDTEVAWMLALAEYEDSLCPSCGMPRKVCQDPMAEFKVQVPPPTRCHVTTAIKRAQKGYEKSPVPEGLLFGAQVPD